METKKFARLFIFVLVVLSFLSVHVSAQEEDGNYLVSGFELEKILFMISALLSLFLFFIAVVAYQRDGRSRLLFVSIGFLLFAVKNFLVSSELFFPEVDWFDPAAVVLEFLALLGFFFGVLKRSLNKSDHEAFSLKNRRASFVQTSRQRISKNSLKK